MKALRRISVADLLNDSPWDEDERPVSNVEPQRNPDSHQNVPQGSSKHYNEKELVAIHMLLQNNQNMAITTALPQVTSAPGQRSSEPSRLVSAGQPPHVNNTQANEIRVAPAKSIKEHTEPTQTSNDQQATQQYCPFAECSCHKDRWYPGFDTAEKYKQHLDLHRCQWMLLNPANSRYTCCSHLASDSADLIRHFEQHVSVDSFPRLRYLFAFTYFTC